MSYNKIFNQIYRLFKLEYIRINDFKSYNFCTWSLMLVLFGMVSILFIPLMMIPLFDLMFWLSDTVCGTSKNVIDIYSFDACSVIDSYSHIFASYWRIQMRYALVNIISLMLTSAVFYIIFVIFGLKNRFWSITTLGTGLIAVASLVLSSILGIITFNILWLGVHAIFDMYVMYLIFAFYLFAFIWFVLLMQRLIFATLHIEGFMSYVFVLLFYIVWFMFSLAMISHTYGNYVTILRSEVLDSTLTQVTKY